MKNLLLPVCLISFLSVLAQDPKQDIMEKKAREFHRVIGSSDKEQWKKYMVENFTKAMLERPVKSKIETSDNESSSTTSAPSAANGLEERMKIFERLHNDFGISKITEMKSSNGMIEMILQNPSGLKGYFNLAFENKKPYLIDRISIEMDQRSVNK